jgi:hypothetical protein
MTGVHFFDAQIDLKEQILKALDSKIYLGQTIDSLYTGIMDVPNENNTSEDVLRKYGAFFKVLCQELDEWSIEGVRIGLAFDATGCKISTTIEMTPTGLFTYKDDRKEASKLSEILEDLYPPEQIIGSLVQAIITQHNKMLIDMLESSVKDAKDLVTNRCRIPAESGSFPGTEDI